MTRDVSPKGIYVASELQPFPGEGLTLSFVLPGCEVPTEALVKVAWLKGKSFAAASGFIPGFGAEFLEIIGKGAPAARESDLESFVALQADFAQFTDSYPLEHEA